MNLREGGILFGRAHSGCESGAAGRKGRVAIHHIVFVCKRDFVCQVNIFIAVFFLLNFMYSHYSFTFEGVSSLLKQPVVLPSSYCLMLYENGGAGYIRLINLSIELT